MPLIREDGKGQAMKSIHVVFGPADAETQAQAYRLAIKERDAFVHEIARSEDVRLVLSSRYRRCVATLEASSEESARRRMETMAAAAQSALCSLTFEAAAQQG